MANLSGKFTIFKVTINLWKYCRVVIAKKKSNCCVELDGVLSTSIGSFILHSSMEPLG